MRGFVSDYNMIPTTISDRKFHNAHNKLPNTNDYNMKSMEYKLICRLQWMVIGKWKRMQQQPNEIFVPSPNTLKSHNTCIHITSYFSYIFPLWNLKCEIICFMIL